MPFIYTYFVYYRIQPAGYGSCEFDLPHRITRSRHIRDIERWLTQQLGQPVMVANYQFLRKTPAPTTPRRSRS
jgi:hypothetical protein